MLTEEEKEAIKWLEEVSNSTRRGKKEIAYLKIIVKLLKELLQ